MDRDDGRRPWRVAVAGCCLAVVALAVECVPAFALSQRGHAFAGGTLSVPALDKALNDPSGVAVNESSGDVYVADQGNDRIVQLGSDGEFLSTWGYGVSNGADEFEVCKRECRAGIAGKNEFQLRRQVQAIAVDNCTSAAGQPCTKAEDPSVGDVYAATRYITAEDEEDEEGHEVIQKFGPDGKQLEWTEKISYQEEGEQVREKLQAEYADGLTVAPNGTVWLYYEERAVCAER